MTLQPVVPREQAKRDAEQAVDYYANEAGKPVALRFIDALENAYRAIAAHPATGSPQYAFELNLPGLRTWPIKRFPYLIFYVEPGQHVDVWRILHAQRHIPAWMR